MAGLDFRAFEYVHYPIFTLKADAEGRPYYAYMNDIGCRLINKPKCQIFGKRADELFAGRMGQSVLQRQREVWVSGVPGAYDIVRMLPDGERWYRTQLTPVHGSAGQLDYLVGASQDVSREVALEQSQVMTTAALSEMEDFVSFAAHDLRSPLGNMKSILEILREDFVDHGDGKAELLDVLDQLADQTLHVVTDVISQALDARAKTEMREFDIASLCNDILVQLDPTRHHDVQVQSARVAADYVAFQIILRNLIDNAFKHADQPRVTMTIEIMETDEASLKLCVQDDGAGFSDPDLAFLDGGGMSADSGFGLLGVRRLVRSRGGCIKAVRPASGRGAEIHVTLPGRLVAQDTTSAQNTTSRSGRQPLLTQIQELAPPRGDKVRGRHVM